MGTAPAALDISPDQIKVFAGGCQCFLRVVPGNKSRVIVEGRVAFPAKTVENGQDSGVLLAEMLPDEINNGHVMAWLRGRTPQLNMKARDALNIAA